LLCFLSGFGFAQTDAETDQKDEVWADVTRTDEARVDDLIHQINLLWEKGQWANSIELIDKIPEFEIGRTSIEYQSFYTIAKAASYEWETQMRLDTLLRGMALAESVDYTFGRLLAYIYTGIYQQRSGNDSLAIDYYNKSIEVAADPQEYHLTNNKAWAETKMAMMMIYQDNEERREYYESEAEKTYSLIKDDPAVYYFFYYELGEAYHYVGKTDRALEYFKKALPYMPEENPFVYSRIAEIYEAQGGWQEALQYYEFSQEKYVEINRMEYEKFALNNMGRMMVKVGQLDQAEEIADQLMYRALSEEEEFPRFRVYSLLGDIATARGESKKAVKHYKSSKEWMEKEGIDNNWWRSMNDLTLSTAYLKERNYSKAIEHCLECQDFFEKGDDPLEQKLVYETLYTAYRESGNDRLALENLEKLVELTKDEDPIQTAKQLQQFEFDKKTLSDSLRQVEKFYRAELAYETELRKNNRSKSIAFGLGGLILLVSFGLWARLRHMRKTKLQLVEKNERIEEEKEKAKSSEETKQQFLANMSHEIRTPMNAIKGMTDILLRRDPQEAQLQYLNAIKESSTSLMVIINDILDFSKIEAGKIDLEKIPFSISQVIGNVCMIMQLRAEEKGLELQQNIEMDIPDQVIGDPTRLHQVLLNLVGNAVKFTEKGMVTIEAKLDTGSVSISPVICFTVSDTGVGIGEDRLEKIFDSFEQAYSDTTRKFGGTGLGLTISKRLVELQGGEIGLTSEKGKGTQFQFTIPYELAEEKAIPMPAKKELNGRVHSIQGAKILLVEDNEFNAIVAQEELEDAISDVEIDVAENGSIAVEKARTGDYDLILMDVQMPVMNGHEATEKIRALDSDRSEIPIIAMTANVLKDEVDLCLEVGMNDFIGKPFDVAELVSKIEALIRIERT
jgi:signal transduction histidine kinase/ActR/RegA family two-component response regulator